MKQAILLGIILSNFPITRAILLHNVRIKYPDLTDRKMRALIEEMVVMDKEPIASSEKGYFIIETPDQLKTAMDYLRKKAKPIQIRANCLMTAYNKRYQSNPINHQISLEL